MVFKDPYKLLFEAINNCYSGVQCIIEFDASFRKRWIFGCWGVTIFPDDGGIPIIKISAWLPVFHSTEIIAHEVAHVIAGIDAQHGEKWEEVFKNIHEEWGRLACNEKP